MNTELVPAFGGDEDGELLALAHALVEVQAELNACFARLLTMCRGRRDEFRRQLTVLPEPEAS